MGSAAPCEAKWPDIPKVCQSYQLPTSIRSPVWLQSPQKTGCVMVPCANGSCSCNKTMPLGTRWRKVCEVNNAKQIPGGYCLPGPSCSPDMSPFESLRAWIKQWSSLIMRCPRCTSQGLSEHVEELKAKLKIQLGSLFQPLCFTGIRRHEQQIAGRH